jgi:hypothetical protein
MLVLLPVACIAELAYLPDVLLWSQWRGGDSATEAMVRLACDSRETQKIAQADPRRRKGTDVDPGKGKAAEGRAWPSSSERREARHGLRSREAVPLAKGCKGEGPTAGRGVGARG